MSASSSPAASAARRSAPSVTGSRRSRANASRQRASASSCCAEPLVQGGGGLQRVGRELRIGQGAGEEDLHPEQPGHVAVRGEHPLGLDQEPQVGGLELERARRGPRSRRPSGRAGRRAPRPSRRAARRGGRGPSVAASSASRSWSTMGQLPTSEKMRRAERRFSTNRGASRYAAWNAAAAARRLPERVAPRAVRARGTGARSAGPAPAPSPRAPAPRCGRAPRRTRSRRGRPAGDPGGASRSGGAVMRRGPRPGAPPSR